VLLAARWGLGVDVRLAIGTHADAPAVRPDEVPAQEPRSLDAGRSEERVPIPLPSALRVAQIVACAMTEDPPVPEWRIAKALNVRTAATSPGPLFDRARSFLHELR
jgi:hypothetical protein